MLNKVAKICTPSFGILAPQLKFFKSGTVQEQPAFLQAKRKFLTTEQEFEVVKAFLNGMDSSSTPALREGLQNLGYKQGKGYKKQQNELWVKNKNMCTLEKFHFGNDVGHKLSLQQSGKKGGRARRVQQVHFGSVILQDRHWNALADYFQQQLGWFIMARAKHPDHDLPVNLDQLKEYIELGKYKQERLKRVKQERKIQKRLSKLVDKVQALMEAGKQPKGVIVYAAGPDSVGKTSTGYIIMDALEAAGYNIRVEWFGAPSAEERAQHWLKRFERGVPVEGEAVFWDRGTAGDIVYGNPPANQAKHMCKEFNCFESWTQENGILMVKMQIYCDRIKQSKTFAKRLARAFVAKIIQQELESRGDLSDEHRDSLDEIANKVGVEDYVAFANYKEIEDGFLSYAKRTELFSKWIVADATKRNKARLRIIEEFNNKVHTDRTNVWEH